MPRTRLITEMFPVILSALAAYSTSQLFFVLVTWINTSQFRDDLAISAAIGLAIAIVGLSAPADNGPEDHAP